MEEIDKKIRENGDKLLGMRGNKSKKGIAPVKTEPVGQPVTPSPEKSASKEIKVDIEVDDEL